MLKQIFFNCNGRRHDRIAKFCTGRLWSIVTLWEFARVETPTM